jgi:type IV pilus assembly protein PilY1
VDNDGYIDFLFAVDITGRLWRIDLVDIPTGTDGDGFATGGVIAELGDWTAGDADYRRFYNSPDVALFRPRGKTAYLSISLGTGYRAHPNNNDLTDRFYTVFDRNAYNAPISDSNGDPVYQYITDGGSLRVIRPDDLGDASDNYVTEVSGAANNALYGWYKNLGSGEKSLSSSVTFAGYTVFTTYSPPSANTCGDLGKARLYVVDSKTGSSRLKEDDDTVLFRVMLHSGIPPEPAIIYASKTSYPGNQASVKPILCVGTECFGDVFDDTSPLTKSFWRENQ